MTQHGMSEAESTYIYHRMLRFANMLERLHKRGIPYDEGKAEALYNTINGRHPFNIHHYLKMANDFEREALKNNPGVSIHGYTKRPIQQIYSSNSSFKIRGKA